MAGPSVLATNDPQDSARDWSARHRPAGLLTVRDLKSWHDETRHWGVVARVDRGAQGEPTGYQGLAASPEVVWFGRASSRSPPPTLDGILVSGTLSQSWESMQHCFPPTADELGVCVPRQWLSPASPPASSARRIVLEGLVWWWCFSLSESSNSFLGRGRPGLACGW